MAKDYARSFYNGPEWRRTQAAYMASQGYVCERCGRPARIVHHRRYITPQNIHDPSVTLDWANLEALCQECHNNEHSQKQSTAIFDSSGEMVGVKESAELEEYKKAIEALQKKIPLFQEKDN